LKREKGQQTTGPITLFSPPGGPVSGEYLSPIKKRGDFWKGWSVGLIIVSYIAFACGVGFSAFAMYKTFPSQPAVQEQDLTNQ